MLTRNDQSTRSLLTDQSFIDDDQDEIADFPIKNEQPPL